MTTPTQHCHTTRTWLLALLAATATAGCLPSSSPSPSVPAIDQTHVCEAKDWQYDSAASQCKPGQKVVFLPNSWGNEQLPVIFAAINCDLRYSVVVTKGAVTCIYGPITPTPPQPRQPSSEAKPAQ